MTTLKGNTIYLRALEPEDLEFIYAIENNESVWEVSNTQTPYSRFLIRQYLENAHQDIYEAKQLRLAICLSDTFEAIGLIDLFEFDPKNKRVGLGILIYNPKNRNQKIGSQAVELLINYVFEFLQVHQIFVNINPKNIASVKLFDNFGFQLIGVKKDWNFYQNTFEDEALYQLLKK